MKPAKFDFVRADTLDEALGVLANEGTDARIIAGGMSFMAMLNMRLARPKVLVDIMRLKGLARIDIGKDVTVSAGIRQAQLLAHPELPRVLPLVSKGLPFTGHVQTRARGTVCGSIAHADPSAELPLCLIALKGQVHLRTARKTRKVPAEEFFTGMMATAKADDEMIEAISFPAAKGEGTAFSEIARRHGDFAIVACAAVATEKSIRFAVGGVADVPTARDFPLLEGSALDDALNTLAWELDARDDVHASARYRRELVRRIGRSTIEEALRCRA